MGREARSMSIGLSSLLLMLLALSAAADHVVKDEKPMDELISGLQQGGYLIYMRHAHTDHSQKDTNRDNLAECSTQRNLSAQGREEAARIFAAVKKLGISFSVIYSSPYCRARDTAKLMANNIIMDEKLQFSIAKDSEEAKKLGQYLYRMMLINDPGDANVLIVGHTSNLRDGLGIWPKPEGVMVVFSVQDDHVTYHGMITPDAWPR